MAELTREQLRDLIRDGTRRVVLLIVNTINTSSDCAHNFVIPTLIALNWRKAGGEGEYQGMRGVYAKSILFNPNYLEYITVVRVL